MLRPLRDAIDDVRRDDVLAGVFPESAHRLEPTAMFMMADIGRIYWRPADSGCASSQAQSWLRFF